MVFKGTEMEHSSGVLVKDGNEQRAQLYSLVSTVNHELHIDSPQKGTKRIARN
jgi:hypothetical protein